MRERAVLRSSLVVLALLAVAPRVAHGDPGSVSVVVRDSSGAVVPGAIVSLMNDQRAGVATAKTDGQGQSTLSGIPVGSYVVVVSAPGFGERHEAVTIPRTGNARLEVTLVPAALAEEVTVTASPGLVQDVDASPQQVNVVDEAEIAARAKSVVAQSVAEEVGLHLQRTSPTVAGVFVRGLTGNKVNVFVDGVRYSTAAARGGINTFMNLNDPASLEAVEVLRGPTSAQYGSDALGGSVQFLTRTPAPSTEGKRLTGVFATSFGGADLSFGSSLRASYAGEKLGFEGALSGRRTNTLRPGAGRDSHNAVTRFFDLDSGLVIDDRLPDTAFTQYGGSMKLTWAPSAGSRVIASYTRGQQDGGRRYDQLLGGDGNLVADLRNLMLDFGYVKYERHGVGPFDRVMLAYSFNRQREERVNQGGNGNPRASINHEYERTTVHGLQASGVRATGRHTISVGGDVYREAVTAPSFGVNPATGAVSVRRGRIPDGAHYTSGGAYLQDVFEATSRVSLLGNVRLSAASYRAEASDSPVVRGRALWPDDSLSVSDVTFRTGAVVKVTSRLTLSTAVSRGFRAPHITDLGTLGTTGSGFEVAAPDIAGLGATLGSTADATASDTGIAVTQLAPESSLSYEATLRYRTNNFDTDLSAFVNDINDNITRQALILPRGAVGLILGEEAIVKQDPSGVVYVGATSSPVLVSANYDDARVWGIEHTMSVKLAPDWSARTAFTYLRARDRRSGLPPNIEGGTPAPEGWLKIRYAPEGGRRFWVESYLHLAARQDRLSSLDLEDRRTGATRSRTSITNFFNNGARARGLIGAGADSAPGTADDVLLATGETLAQILDRVLGGARSAPLFTTVPAYAVFGVRGGVRFGGRHEVFVDVENIGDRNYRGISWGIDAPGRGVYVRYSTRL